MCDEEDEEKDDALWRCMTLVWNWSPLHGWNVVVFHCCPWHHSHRWVWTNYTLPSLVLSAVVDLVSQKTTKMRDFHHRHDDSLGWNKTEKYDAIVDVVSWNRPE